MSEPEEPGTLYEVSRPDKPPTLMSMGNIVDELTYINYRHNRRSAPHITPERWAKIYSNAKAMERRYQEETHAANPV